MVVFASLFLGLIVGVQPVTVLVERPVTEVRLELDGRMVGRMDGQKWTLLVDFGKDPFPHELVAHAIDANGTEIDTARQFVNLPRPPAEMEVLLERGAGGHPVAAKFSSQSVSSFRPSRATVTFDGKPLRPESGRVVLPPYDKKGSHLLSIELEFSPAARTRADVLFGPGVSNVARSELTAVAVRSPLRDGFRQPADFAGALVREGQPLSIVAVEEGPALVCIVRNPNARQAVESLDAHEAFFGRGRYWLKLGDGNRARFLWPAPREGAPGASLYDSSGDFTDANGGFFWLLTRIQHPAQQEVDAEPAILHLADGTAVAGLEATASGIRRGVVLVLGDEKVDASRDAPAAVRRYLETIHVPLVVWSLTSPSVHPLAPAWGKVEDISSPAKLEAAFKLLQAELGLQRIVWVEGRHLPQDIALSDKVPGLDFAR